MSDGLPLDVNDGYEAFYLEKIWHMIPEYYRHEDGLAQPPEVLRSLVALMAQQAARVRRSHDRLWQDQSIEHCQPWAVPYIGDLLATRLLSALNARGRRVDVAKTIYYRRRKGTLGVLEELIGDITGWEGKVVEGFRRLSRTRHALDPALVPAEGAPAGNRLTGRLTGTPQGGTADLRVLQGAHWTATAFDEFFHTPDFRRHTGQNGRHNIPKLAFHIYRLAAYPVVAATPFRLDAQRYAFDPSGREIPLFSARRRADDWHAWRSIERWELPAPIACHLLNHAEFVIANRLLQALAADFGVSAAAIDALGSLAGIVHKTENGLRQLIALLGQPELVNPAVQRFILARSLVDHCGKQRLLPDSLAVYRDGAAAAEDKTTTTAANLAGWPLSVPDQTLLVDPQRGLFQFVGGAPARATVDYHYGLAMGFGAGSHSRGQVERFDPDTRIGGGGPITATDLHNQGITQIDDSATYGPLSDKLKVRDLALQAANGQRPYIVLATNWVLRADVKTDEAQPDAMLRLDGVWLGSSDADNRVVLRGDGDYEQVTIRHCTFDPGGCRTIAGDPIWPVALVVEAKVECLVIEKSILGPIVVAPGGSIEQLQIRDSIVDAAAHSRLLAEAGESGPPTAVEAPNTTLNLERCTVLGTLNINRLWASEAILSMAPDITDTQTGCFRFSAAPVGSRLPRPYESHFFEATDTLFAADVFGRPDYARLSDQAAAAIGNGAENRSEMGVYSSSLAPIKQANLLTKVGEYMPFGMIPLMIFET